MSPAESKHKNNMFFSYNHFGELVRWRFHGKRKKCILVKECQKKRKSPHDSFDVIERSEINKKAQTEIL